MTMDSQRPHGAASLISTGETTMPVKAGRDKANRKVSTLRAATNDALDPNSPINAFTLIRECATTLALTTPRYRRARHLLKAKLLEDTFLEGEAVDPDFSEQRKLFSDAARELRAQLCFLAAGLPETAGGVLRGLMAALCRNGHDASAEQFGDMAEVFAAWNACERLLDFGDFIGPNQNLSEGFTIPSDAKPDAINANLAMLLASFCDYLKWLGFSIPGEDGDLKAAS